jgi:SAM-dependent methyltransferase
MSTKSPDSAGINWESSEVAERRNRGRARRVEIQGPATQMMLDLAEVRTGSRVLDVAAGTGDQTVLAAQRVGATGCVLATDISVSMLKLASDTAAEAGLTNVETRVMDAEKIDLEPDSYDAVICQLGLMLFPDPVRCCEQCAECSDREEKLRHWYSRPRKKTLIKASHRMSLVALEAHRCHFSLSVKPMCLRAHSERVACSMSPSEW